MRVPIHPAPEWDRDPLRWACPCGCRWREEERKRGREGEREGGREVSRMRA